MAVSRHVKADFSMQPVDLLRHRLLEAFRHTWLSTPVCAFRLYVHKMVIHGLHKDFADKMPRSRLLKA